MPPKTKGKGRKKQKERKPAELHEVWQAFEKCSNCNNTPTAIVTVTAENGQHIFGLRLCKFCAAPYLEPGAIKDREDLPKSVLAQLKVHPLAVRPKKAVRDYRWKQRPTLTHEVKLALVSDLLNVPIQQMARKLSRQVQLKILEDVCQYNRRLSPAFKAYLAKFALIPTLEEYTFAGMMLNPFDIEVAAYFTTLNSPVTHSVNFCWNPMDTHCARAVVRAAAKTSNLTSLDMSWCRLGREGMQVVTEALLDNGHLKVLKVAGNQLDGAEGAKPLRDLVRFNTSLNTLVAGFQRLQRPGMEVLGEGLKHNSTLTELNLRGCELGSEGATALAKSLCDNRTLVSLIAADNAIGREGARVLASFVRISTPMMIKCVDPEGAGIPVAVRRKRAQELEKARREAAYGGNEAVVVSVGKTGVVRGSRDFWEAEKAREAEEKRQADEAKAQADKFLEEARTERPTLVVDAASAAAAPAGGAGSSASGTHK